MNLAGEGEQMAATSTHLNSDDIRARERKRRRGSPLWGALSLLFHGGLFVVIVLMTPVKSLVFEQPQAHDVAKELSAERISEIAQALQEARVNELMRQLQAMQTVLHNVDLLKEELQKDYDAFADATAGEMKPQLEKLVAEAEQAQRGALAEQPQVRAKAESIIGESRHDLTADESRAQQLFRLSGEIQEKTGERVNAMQAGSANALDRLQVQAAFAGYRQTAAAAEKARAAQVETASLQNRAQKETGDLSWKMGEIFYRARDAANLRQWQQNERNSIENMRRDIQEAEQQKLRAEALKDADWARREGERKERDLSGIERLTKRVDELGREAERKDAERREFEALREEQVLKGSVLSAFDAASRMQQEVLAGMEALRQVLASDEPQREKLVKADRVENELVTASGANLSLADAYELVRRLEEAVTESYKDVKATETAIARRMSFQAAQQLTDVARPVRAAPNRELLARQARTKEALDAQKAETASLVREADGMVEAAVAMMEETMALVLGDEGAGGSQAEKTRSLRWLTPESLSQERAGAETLDERLKSMMADADYQVALDSAAAEDESARAKDLTGLMADFDAVVRNTQAADAMPGLESSSGGAQLEPPHLTGDMPGLVPGNVLAVTAAGEGVPAEWMYVNSWYVIGPFPNPDRVNLRRKFPPESVIDLDAMYPGKDGKMLRWRFMQAGSTVSTQDWRRGTKAEVVPEGWESYTIWYAYAEVVCDAPCERWIAVGSDDRSDVWVNDVPVWGSSNQLKNWRVDEGFRRIRLQRGVNRILARIENGWHALGWSVCISVGAAKPTRAP